LKNKVKNGEKFMEEYKLLYDLKEDYRQISGCIAKAASRARENVKANVTRKGTSKHNYIVTRKAASLDRDSDNKRKRTVKSEAFMECYMRLGEVKTKKQPLKDVSGLVCFLPFSCFVTSNGVVWFSFMCKTQGSTL
jgi:hypothetical protein